MNDVAHVQDSTDGMTAADPAARRHADPSPDIWVPIPSARMGNWVTGRRVRICKADDEISGQVCQLNDGRLRVRCVLIQGPPAVFALSDTSVSVWFRLQDLPEDLGWVDIEPHFAFTLPAGTFMRATSGDFAIEGERVETVAEEDHIIAVSVSSIGPIVRCDLDEWNFAVRARASGLAYPGVAIRSTYPEDATDAERGRRAAVIPGNRHER